MHSPLVRDLMSSPVISVSRWTRLPAIKSIMREKHIRRLAVVHNEQLVGVISLGDVRNAFPSDATTLSAHELSYLLDKVMAQEIMRTGVITVDADAPVVEAAKLMLAHKVSGLPVLSAGRLVGMITENDILRKVVEGQIRLPLAADKVSSGPRERPRLLV